MKCGRAEVIVVVSTFKVPAVFGIVRSFTVVVVGAI